MQIEYAVYTSLVLESVQPLLLSGDRSCVVQIHNKITTAKVKKSSWGNASFLKGNKCSIFLILIFLIKIIFVDDNIQV